MNIHWQFGLQLQRNYCVQCVVCVTFSRYHTLFTTQCTLVHLCGLGIACHPSVCLSVCLPVTFVICDHIGWKSWKIIAQTISPAPSLSVAKRRSTYSQGDIGKFGGD